MSTLYGTVSLEGHIQFTHNTADKDGGATNMLYGTVSLQGPTQFTHNTANRNGGAMFIDGTVIQILEKTNFSFNSAKYGGAMFFTNGASLTLSYLYHTDRVTLLTSSFNKASEDGGVIYHRDSPSFSQCSFSASVHIFNYICIKLPNRFLLFKHYSSYPVIVSKNDSAKREGNFMFGGLMDRCRQLYHYYSNSIIDDTISIYPHSHPTTRELSSLPYSLCMCAFSHVYCDISQVLQVQVKVLRGQKFTVTLQAETQYGPTATIVNAITGSTARLDTYQTSQPLPDYCAPLSYTVYSTESHEQVVLYPDGPCRDTGTARVVIDVTLLPCPDGFTQSGEICTCEDRLHDFRVKCTIANTPYLTKIAGLNFWMGVVDNSTYQGLVLCKSCPAEYCKKGAVNVTIDNPDMQCDLNRTGLLCGACAANHSLMLGSSQCQVCPNAYVPSSAPPFCRSRSGSSCFPD